MRNYVCMNLWLPKGLPYSVFKILKLNPGVLWERLYVNA